MKFKNSPNFFMPPNAKVFESDAEHWVIADVHGCADEFRELCENIHKVSKNPVIIQMGDLIDRGPKFYEVFEVVKDYNITTLVGNHEMNFILEHYGMKKINSKPRKISHERFNRLDVDKQDEVMRILQSSSNYCVVHTHEFLFTWVLSHSPIRNLEDELSTHWNDDTTNAWRYCSRNDPYSDKFCKDYIRAAHGHQHWNFSDVDKQIQRMRNDEVDHINLDGGCVYGGELIALCLDTLETISVKGKEYHNM